MVRLTGRLDMTIVVVWDVKPQIKHNKTKITTMPHYRTMPVGYGIDLYLTADNRNKEKKTKNSGNLIFQSNENTGPDSSFGRVSAPGNGRSRVRSRAATYQSRKKWY